MTNKLRVRNRTFMTNSDSCGVFELRNGALLQHRGNAKCFKSVASFRRYVQRMLSDEAANRYAQRGR